MSLLLIQQAFEQALATIPNDIPTAFENDNFDPAVDAVDQPYQECTLIPAEPENPEIIGGSLTRESGIFQVTLRYPTGAGKADAGARAELLKSKFKHGETFTQGGVTVQIDGTPHVMRGYATEDRWCVPVSINYFANIA